MLNLQKKHLFKKKKTELQICGIPMGKLFSPKIAKFFQEKYFIQKTFVG